MAKSANPRGRASTEPTTGHPTEAICPAWCQARHLPDFPIGEHSATGGAIPGTGDPETFRRTDTGLEVPGVYVTLYEEKTLPRPHVLLTVHQPGPDDDSSRWCEIRLLTHEVEALAGVLSEAHRQLATGGPATYSPAADDQP